MITQTQLDAILIQTDGQFRPKLISSEFSGLQKKISKYGRRMLMIVALNSF